MKKLFAIGLSAVMVLSLLAACGSGDTPAPASNPPSGSAPAETTPSDEPVVLEMWAMTDDEGRYDTMIEQYTELHPNVTINKTCYASTEIDQALTTALAGREPIDLFVSNGIPYLEGRVSTGMAEPLNSYLEGSGLDMSLYGSALESTYANGECYGLPYRDSPSVIVYNKDIFEERGVEPPTADTTWDELLDIAEKVTYGEGPDKVYGLYNAARNSDWNGMAFNNGVFSVSEDLTLLGKAMEWKLDAIERGVILDNAAYTAAGIGIRPKFVAGGSSMYFGGDWTIGQLVGDARKGELDFNWDVAPMPMMDDGTGRMKTASTYVTMSLCSYSKNKAAAFDFLKFMCGPEGAEIMAADGMVPGYKTENAKELFCKANEEFGSPANIELYFELETVNAPMVKGFNQVETLVKQEADMVFSGQETVEQALENIYSGRESIMN